MAEYIEREKMTFHLAQELEFLGEPDSSHQPVAYGCVNGLKTALSYANDIPTADVVEVRHGYWYITEYEYFTCSECGNSFYNGCESTAEAKQRLKDGLYDNYCGHCGAKMDGKGDLKH